MKLPIKKKYFDQIKSGEKEWEYRDAHITFVCEETDETLRKEVTAIGLRRYDEVGLSKKEIKEVFEDTIVMAFKLGEE